MKKKPIEKNRLIFLVKDPHWTFIWWDFCPASIKEVENQTGKNITETKLTLRIHDITDIYFDKKNSHYYFDIETNSCTNYYYLEIRESNRVYCAEIGLKEEDNYYPIVKSNTLFLPTDRPSDSFKNNWTKLAGI